MRKSLLAATVSITALALSSSQPLVGDTASDRPALAAAKKFVATN